MIAIFPEIAHLSMTGDFEALSVAIRRYFAVGKPTDPKLDLEALVKDFGIRVRFEAADCPAIMVGMDRNGRFEFEMLLSSSLSPLESKFAMAHLLGHFLFDIQPLLARGEFDKSGWKEDVSPLVRYLSRIVKDDGEQLSDQFAAALMLPQGMVLRAFEKLSDPKQVGDVFGVSGGLVTRRLEDLERLSPRTKALPKFEESLASPQVNYKKTVEAYPKPQTPANVDQGPRKTQGMDRIRELARKIDKSIAK